MENIILGDDFNIKIRKLGDIGIEEGEVKKENKDRV